MTIFRRLPTNRRLRSAVHGEAGRARRTAGRRDLARLLVPPAAALAFMVVAVVPFSAPPTDRMNIQPPPIGTLDVSATSLSTTSRSTP